MRLTYRQTGRAYGARANLPAPPTSMGSSFPSPVGGWDSYSPVSEMPPQNAVQLINWYPQQGYVELRRGYVKHVDTGTNGEVDSLMSYQGPGDLDAALLAASGGEIWDVTGGAPSSLGSGYLNNRWQSVNFTTAGGNFLWMCNGDDDPQYFDGSTIQTATITGTNAADMIACTSYRGRIWTVLKNSTKAAYLPLDSIQGHATEFDLGPYFTMGGSLQAICTWSSDIGGGTNEFIVFISEYGECAIFLIYDPTSGSTFSYRGISKIGSPIGRRCVEKFGSDVAVITIDGVLPVSQIVNYDRAALQQSALTRNIQNAMVEAARAYKNNFGWQIISYPRNTMALVNVPIAEGGQQEQFVMNTNGMMWCRFTGQNANCWAVFQDRLYFGGNDGSVYLADEAAGDENSTLVADMQGAYNYFGSRGQNKRWTTIRPLIDKDSTYDIKLEIGLSIDFNQNDTFDTVFEEPQQRRAIWDNPETIWNDPKTVWPGIVTKQDWAGCSGIGYCAGVHMRVSIEWTEILRVPQILKVYSFDTLFNGGAFI